MREKGEGRNSDWGTYFALEVITCIATGGVNMALAVKCFKNPRKDLLD